MPDGTWMLSGPSTPPAAAPPPVYSSEVVLDDSGGVSSGAEKVSEVRSTASKSRSAVTVAKPLPAPTTRSSTPCRAADTRLS